MSIWQSHVLIAKFFGGGGWGGGFMVATVIAAEAGGLEPISAQRSSIPRLNTFSGISREVLPRLQLLLQKPQQELVRIEVVCRAHGVASEGPVVLRELCLCEEPEAVRAVARHSVQMACGAKGLVFRGHVGRGA